MGSISELQPEHPTLLKLARLMRSGIDRANKVKVYDLLPPLKLANMLRENAAKGGSEWAGKLGMLTGDMGLAEATIGEPDKALENLAYGFPLMSKNAGSFYDRLNPGTLDLAGLGLGGASSALKYGPKVAKGLSTALREAEPLSSNLGARQAGRIEIPSRPHPRAGQAELEGIESTPEQRAATLRGDYVRASDDAMRRVFTREEQRAFELKQRGEHAHSSARMQGDRARNEAQNADDELLGELDSRLTLATHDQQRANALREVEELNEMRAARNPSDNLDDTLAREEDILRGKLSRPIATEQGPMVYSNDTGMYRMLGEDGVESFYPSERMHSAQLRDPYVQRQDAVRTQRELVRQLREASDEVRGQQPQIPAWADELTTDPSLRSGGQGNPNAAGERWWQENLPEDSRSTEAFMRGLRDQEGTMQFGRAPEGDFYSLEDFADEFGKQNNRRIYVESEPSDDVPYKVEKTHGYGEVMRDRHGDYIGEYETHERGDVPVKDEYGDIKKVKKGLDEEGDPIKKKYVAEGGEPRFNRHGDQEFIYEKSEGGEPVRDERGNVKEIENPDYEDSYGDKVTMSEPGRGHITIEGMNSGDPLVTATEAGESGALLYQALLGHMSRTGEQIPTNTNLSPINQLRLLSNATANYVRTGVNPRSVTGTASGAEPAARGFASGPEMLRAISGESRARLESKGKNPEAMQFTGDGFTYEGQPISYDEIGQRIEELSPNFKGGSGGGKWNATGVGPKTMMQDAVFRWLRQATPQEAEKVAKSWGERMGGPLFGTAVGVPLLSELLRDDARD